MDGESALLRLRQRIESTAEWRRRQSLEHPEESWHVEAARLLDKLAADLSNVPDREAEAYAAMRAEDRCLSVAQIEGEALRAVGFYSAPENATNFVRSLTSEFADQFAL
jgi:hypothetical protein